VSSQKTVVIPLSGTDREDHGGSSPHQSEGRLVSKQKKQVTRLTLATKIYNRSSAKGASSGVSSHSSLKDIQINVEKTKINISHGSSLERVRG